MAKGDRPVCHHTIQYLAGRGAKSDAHVVQERPDGFRVRLNQLFDDIRWHSSDTSMNVRLKTDANVLADTMRTIIHTKEKTFEDDVVLRIV